MTDPHLALASLNLLAAVAAPGDVAARPYTPALIIGLCVAAGLMTWLALPGRWEAAVRRIGLIGLYAVGLVGAAFLVRWTVNLGGMSVYFWLFSAVALFASVRVITHQKPVYSALYFVLTVFATGGLFVLLWAEFIAAALVLIYAGAILITYVFVIMLASEAVTGGGADSVQLVSDHDAKSRDPFWAAMTGFAVMGLLVYLVFDQSAATAAKSKVDYAALFKVYQSPGNGLSWESLKQRAEGNVLYADGHVDWTPSWGYGQQDNIYTQRSNPSADPKPAPKPGSGGTVIEISPDGTSRAIDPALGFKPSEPAMLQRGRGTSSAPREPQNVVYADSAATDLAAREADLGSAQMLGVELIENQALNIQLAGIILTVAMVGAITLARRRVIVTEPTGGHETLSTPATPADDNPHSIAVYGTDNPRHKAYPEN